MILIHEFLLALKSEGFLNEQLAYNFNINPGVGQVQVVPYGRSLQ